MRKVSIRGGWEGDGDVDTDWGGGGDGADGMHGLFSRIYPWSRRCKDSSGSGIGGRGGVVIGRTGVVAVLGGQSAGHGERRWQRVSSLTGVPVVIEGGHAVNGTG